MVGYRDTENRLNEMGEESIDRRTEGERNRDAATGDLSTAATGGADVLGGDGCGRGGRDAAMEVWPLLFHGGRKIEVEKVFEKKPVRLGSIHNCVNLNHAKSSYNLKITIKSVTLKSYSQSLMGA